MALYDKTKSKISRQELELLVDGRNLKQYAAKVKYLPENIEKPGFFDLCCGVVNPGDTITIRTKLARTNKEESYDVVYKFLVLNSDTEAKSVEVLQLKKVDLLNPIVNVEVDGIDTDELNEAITIIVEAKVRHIVEQITELSEKFEAYTTDTDDQLEEIETNIAKLTEQVEIGEATKTDETSEINETQIAQ